MCVFVRDGVYVIFCACVCVCVRENSVFLLFCVCVCSAIVISFNF